MTLLRFTLKDYYKIAHFLVQELVCYSNLVDYAIIMFFDLLDSHVSGKMYLSTHLAQKI